jgi:outer membrane protein assembly factor BamC
LRPEYYADKPPRPDAIHGSDSRDEVRIQRLGNRSWLAIPEDPTTVWPKVKQFLAENGVSLARELPAEGRVDSVWLEIGNEQYRDIIRSTIRDGKDAAQMTGGRDRVRVRVEPGLRERTSEVHIRYENDAFSPPGADNLVNLEGSVSHDAAIEQSLLNELGAYIAARVAEQTVSMVAQDMGGGVKSFLDRDAEGDPVLRFLVDFERTWATIGQSLVRANIEVEDSDQAAGLYVINVPEDLEVGDVDEKGFFGRLFSFGSADLETLQIRVQSAEDGSQIVTASAADGGKLDREFHQEVLVMLREFSS